MAAVVVAVLSLVGAAVAGALLGGGLGVGSRYAL